MEADLKAAKEKCKKGKKFLKLQGDDEAAIKEKVKEIKGLRAQMREMDGKNAGLMRAIRKLKQSCNASKGKKASGGKAASAG